MLKHLCISNQRFDDEISQRTDKIKDKKSRQNCRLKLYVKY